MVRKGKALVKATTPASTGSTTGNPSLPLNDTYFDTVCQNNAGKLVGWGIVCERPLKFPDAIPDLVRHKIEKQGWNFLYNDTIPVNTTLVREFCPNFAQLKQTEVYLRGKMVPFTFAVIHDILEITRLNIRGKDDLQKSLDQHKQKVFDMAPVFTIIGRDEGTWSDDPDVQGIPPRLKQKKLNLEARLWYQIIVTYLDPDAVHKVHAGKRQSLALPCLIMKIAHSNRIPQRPGDDIFQIPRAARYIPYGDWDEWGIQLKKRKKRSEAVSLNQLPALVLKPPTPWRATDLGYVMQLLHQVLQGQRRIDRRCQIIERFLQHTFPDFDISQLDPVTPEHEPPSAERSEDFMDAEGGEDDDQDSERGVDEADDKPYFDGLGGKDDLKRVLRACILENHEEKKQMASCPSNYSCVGNS
ncbi:hypothetical protein PIB30_093881 [Stylosanthes scabra]|uniref:Putative plant transposon protein domain-containing protein n=1 Tax=Stylosanthes scabra TaxID=79078 RepID=A0ABU6VVE8_9FABA|nr:hypothetical protein [Stylosanthes scabra]